MPTSSVAQSTADHVPSNLMLATRATIDIEHAAVSYGRSVRNAVEPTTVPVRSPDSSPSVSNSVQTASSTAPINRRRSRPIACTMPQVGMIALDTFEAGRSNGLQFGILNLRDLHQVLL